MKRLDDRYWMLDAGQVKSGHLIGYQMHVTVVGKQAKFRIQSFTIIESVIATSIIAILIGLSAMIYSKVLASDKPLAVYVAQATVASMMHEVKTNKAFFSKTVVPIAIGMENCSIAQEVNFYRGNENLYEVSYAISLGKKVWFTEKHLVRSE